MGRSWTKSRRVVLRSKAVLATSDNILTNTLLPDISRLLFRGYR